MLIDLLMFGFWIVLVVYVFWFLFKAKIVQPLTLDDLALTWKVHKQESGSKSTRIHGLIKENEEIIAFKCDCGYEFDQKRLISKKSLHQVVDVQKTPEHTHDKAVNNVYNLLETE